MNFLLIPKTISRFFKQISNLEFTQLRLLDADSSVMLLTSLIVGILSGIGAVLFRNLIDWLQNLAYKDIYELIQDYYPLHLILIPAIGGAFVGPLVYYFAREAKGHGVPEVMESLELRGGRIRPRVVVVKSLASSICIASGGSVGREGPIAQIGSAIGSFVGQVLKLSDDRIRTLVACGAAGGIAATFNAPIAGAVFALEVLLRRFGSVYFGAVVISAVTADVIAHYFEGDQRTFLTPDYALNSPWELLLYTLMGMIAALASVGFSRLLYFSEDIWGIIPLPEPVKPILGGVLLGVLGIFSFQVDGFPRVFGVGYDTIESSLFSHLTLQMTFGLLLLKLLATTITLGSGGSGGIFAPSLFMGAMLGGTFGHFAHSIFPETVAPSGAYALVGMAAFFGGVAHAPITAILILFEMTGDYQIILPLMLATVVSTIVSRNVSKDSIYTLKLKRRGVLLSQDTQAIDLMQGVTAEMAMNQDTDKVRLDMQLLELMSIFSSKHYHALPVIKQNSELAGLVTIKELDQLKNQEELESKTVADILSVNDPPTILPHQPVWMALRHLEAQGEGCVPVIAEIGSKKLLGVLRRIDIIRAYNNAVSERAQDQHHDEILNIRKLNRSGLSEVVLNADSPFVGKRVRELSLGEDTLMVSVRRNNGLRIVRGETILHAGDQVTIFAETPKADLIEKYLNGSLKELELTEQSHVSHREVEISKKSIANQRKIRDLNFPVDCVVVKITRDGRIILPKGETVLQRGDILEIFGIDEKIKEAESYLNAG
ncbi:MAG: chloride channel protein [Deltaproteobacteria bacterium]|nr:chloride channel protein [Deltaproteobacteria bacterium]|tara:strand:- start:34 stop:2346 length:2313 start_codon:yes stop_codon:yes gene_type:complete